MHGLPYTVALVILLVLAPALFFADRILIKELAFIVTGIILGIIRPALGAAYLENFGLVIGAAIGFIGGIIPRSWS